MLTLNEEKKEHVLKLINLLAEIDAAMEPLREHRKELRTQFIENEWLTNDEFSITKKAYNALKSRSPLDEIQTVVDFVKTKMDTSILESDSPSDGE